MSNQQVYHTQFVVPSQHQYPQQHAPVVYTESYQQQQATTFKVPTHSFGSTPQVATCPNCHQTSDTTVKKEIGLGNIIGAVVCCAVGLGCGCCLIPLAVDSLKDSVHTCRSCGTIIGKSAML